MKALWKLIGVIVLVTLTGCAGHLGTVAGAGAGAALGGPGGAVVGAVVGNMADNGIGIVGHHTGRRDGAMRTGRCDPPPSDALIAWATELENPQQKRVARATSTNGRVQCYASESGSSQIGGRPNGGVPQAGGNPSVYRWTPPTSGRGSSRIIDMD